MDNKLLLLSKLKAYFFDESIPMERKNFFLALLYAIIADALMLVCFNLFHFGDAVCMLAFVLLLCCAGFAYIAIYYKKYKLMTHIFCIVLNVVIYPLFYVIAGDVYNGICLYFASGIILTFFLTSGVMSVVMVCLEVIWYSYLLIFTYFNPDMLLIYRENTIVHGAMYANFLGASLIPVLIMAYQTEIYNNLRDSEDRTNFSIKNAENGKTRFLANMTHEIRNPMNAIVGLDELLLRENLFAESRECAISIKESSSDLLKIINNILVYSKLEAGLWESKDEIIDVYSLVREVVDSFSREAFINNIFFRTFIDRNIPKTTFGDIEGIKQIFTYLLYNSIQRNERINVALEIGCIKDPSNHSVKFKCRIAERGTGISERDRESIIGAYKEYDSRQSTSLKGMGLEIAICSLLLSRMNGNINIESVKGLGIAINFEFTNYILDDEPMIELNDEASHSEILVFLNKIEDDQLWKPLMENLGVSPEYVTNISYFKDALERRNPTKIFMLHNDYSKLKELIEEHHYEDITYVVAEVSGMFGDFGNCKILRRPISSINISEALNNKWNKADYCIRNDNMRVIFPNARILIVEDSIINQKVLSGLLESLKVKTDAVHSAQRCFELLSTEKYDMVMLEQNIPDMDCVEAIHVIRRISEFTVRMPILCITSELGRDIGKMFLDKGFDDYLAKPIKEYYLEKLLKKYLPLELIEYEEVKNEMNIIEHNDSNKKIDPLEIDFRKGVEGVGGEESIYLPILSTYYSEGRAKMLEVPNEAFDSDLSLFTTNVHALKSSSAAVGAVGISAYFKELEFAGKDNNRGLIESELSYVLDNFEIVLNKVKDYLESRGYSVEETDIILEDDSQEVSGIDIDLVESLIAALGSFNLKASEEKIIELSSHNYGIEINSYVKDIKKNFDVFEYFAAKERADNLLNYLKK